MSLMDTIKGAREEVDANGTFDRSRSSKESTKDAEAPASSSQGFTRRSASKAKPTRKAAAGVRVVNSSGKTKDKSTMTKEERKAERRHDREVDDLRYNVTQKILEEREDYQRIRKVWWRCLIVGVVFMVLAIIQYIVVSNMGSNAPELLGITGLLTMVIAYIAVIGGIIYDWIKIRPMRKEADAYVQSMSEKRLVTAINKESKKGKK